MVKTFEAYKKMDWGDFYLTSFPSGEVIYITGEDILPLQKLNLIFFDDNRGALSMRAWACGDHNVSKIKDYLANKRIDIDNASDPDMADSILTKAYRDYLDSKKQEEQSMIQAIKSKIAKPDEKQIAQFLDYCGLLKDQWKVNDDGSIDAFGPVNMSYQNLVKIPIKFNKCFSDFNC